MWSSEVAACKILDTSKQGLPQKRERMFLVAIRLDSLSADMTIDDVFPANLKKAHCFRAKCYVRIGFVIPIGRFSIPSPLERSPVYRSVISVWFSYQNNAFPYRNHIVLFLVLEGAHSVWFPYQTSTFLYRNHIVLFPVLEGVYLVRLSYQTSAFSYRTYIIFFPALEGVHSVLFEVMEDRSNTKKLCLKVVLEDC